MNSLDSLYAGAFLQFTTGLIGWPGLCIFISPFMEGAQGFMFVYFHLESFGMRVVQISVKNRIETHYDMCTYTAIQLCMVKVQCTGWVA